MFPPSVTVFPLNELPLFTSCAKPKRSAASLRVNVEAEPSYQLVSASAALAAPARHAVIISKQKSALTARRDFHWGGEAFPIEMGIVHNITPNSLTLSKFVRKGYIDIEDGFLCCTED